MSANAWRSNFQESEFRKIEGTQTPCNLYFGDTFMGEAARSKPAIVPPMTRPSAHAKETLNPPPKHWRFPPLGSGGINEPVKERIL